MISASYSQSLPLYSNPTLRGDLWDLTWLNHIIVLYCPAKQSELHNRFITLFKMAAYAALCNKAIADDYYQKMGPEIAKVVENQGGERPQNALNYYENGSKATAQLESKQRFCAGSLQENSIPIYSEPTVLLEEVVAPIPAIPPQTMEVSSPVTKTVLKVEPYQKLWASYRAHPHQRGETGMPSFHLFVQGVMARERGLADLVASIVWAGWSSGVKAEDIPLMECGVSEQTLSVFTLYLRHLSAPGGFLQLPLLLQTLILESALAKTARGLFGLKIKTQVGSWLDWYDLLKKGPIVVKATIGDRYQKGQAIPTGESWNGEAIYGYPVSAFRVPSYSTWSPVKTISVVMGANSLILVGGKSVQTKEGGYGESFIYFRQRQEGPLFRMTWTEFRQNLVSFDGLLYSSTPKGKQSSRPAVWAIYSK